MNAKQEKVLIALMSERNIKEASQSCGISGATIYRYLSDADFKREYRRRRREAVEIAVADIQLATSEAAATLRKNLHCENAAVETRTAQIIFENAIKGIEQTDILERLETLENERLKQTEKP